MANKICITGASGTIGRILTAGLKHHDITALQGRADLDLMDAQAVEDYFTANEFDCVIHCAIAGAADIGSPDFDIFRNNWVMYNNLEHMGHSYRKLINIASGAELGYGARRREYDLTQSWPTEPYALSKNMIARDVIKHIGWCNLRLYGIIANTRVFEVLQAAVDRGETTFTMFNDKYMDYIQPADIVKIVEHYVTNWHTQYRDINMVYVEKRKVSEVLQQYIIDNKLNIELKINTEPVEGNNKVRYSSLDYTGSGVRLQRMNIL